MGIYLNPKNENFRQAINSEIYVDKSGIIENTNKVFRTEQKFICVSRPRRFGKSMAADMLVAYYCKGCDSRELFSDLKISKSDSFEKYLNKYDVIRLEMQSFADRTKNVEDMLKLLEKRVINELKKNFDVNIDDTDLPFALEQIFDCTSQPFVFVIDEWDCVLRDNKNNEDAQKLYLDFLRNLFKGKSYVALAYMTGILPIKKYGKHSAINMFTEISMTNAHKYTEFTGFTEDEVKILCDKYDMSFEETKHWYDGYNMKGISIYNPRSVVMSMIGHDFDNYWTSTETYEALKIYIEMNFDGLKDTVINMLAGESVPVDTTTFTNDMTSVKCADDVLTLLIHLGYLTYDFSKKTVSIPNHEISEQFASTIKIIGWSEVAESIKLSDDLLEATLNCDEEKVAKYLDRCHTDNTSILKYNDENSLSCVISIAYYSARKNYTVHRELPAGKGFADLVFLPRRNCSTPAFIAELKYDKTAETAIDQIKKRSYMQCLKDYTGDILLVGINYDKDNENKPHSCKIEKIQKQ